jgi:hypothetical protein
VTFFTLADVAARWKISPDHARGLALPWRRWHGYLTVSE